MSTEAALHWFLAWGRAARFAFASRTLQAAISSSVRRQPLHTPFAWSITHTLMQGDGTWSAGAALVRVSREAETLIVHR